MATTVEDIRRRLYEDTAYWAEHCAKIVDKERRLVPLKPNAAQLRLDAKLEEQRSQGLPMRVIILKARQMGFSTWVEAKIMHRISQRENRRALVVAHNKDAAANLFRMSERIWTHLPDEAGLKPPRLHYRRGAYMLFANLDRESREAGDYGLDSSLQVDTAKEVEAGRSHTFSELHLSEVAFWPHVEKMDSLLNAVPDVVDSMVVVESTANGTNHFKTSWDRAVAGESEYAHLFFPWFDEPSYRLDPVRTEMMFGRIPLGEGPWGEDEPRLQEEFGCDLGQLAWRRFKIVDACGSKLEKWNQEYPATPQDAFQASGKHVFSMQLVRKVLERTEETDPKHPQEGGLPHVGLFEAGRTIPRQVRSGTVRIPADPKFRPKPWQRQRVTEGSWRVWVGPEPGWKPGDRWDRPGEPPKAAIPKGRYVVSVDPAEGAETTSGESAFMAVQVIDHRSKAQCAEYRSREHWYDILDQAFMAALHYNLAWISVEKTGGYGLSMIQRLRDYAYPAIYRRSQPDTRQPVDPDELFGFNTTRATKPLLEDGIEYLLGTMSEVFQSYLLAYEMSTYVKDPSGKTGPEPDAFADLLMSFAIGQQVAQELPIPTDRGPTSTTTRRGTVNPVTKYGA